jgi:hypothetical protein
MLTLANKLNKNSGGILCPGIRLVHALIYLLDLGESPLDYCKRKYPISNRAMEAAYTIAASLHLNTTYLVAGLIAY